MTAFRVAFYSSPSSQMLEFHQYDHHRLLLRTLQLNIHWQVIIRRCILSLSN